MRARRAAPRTGGLTRLGGRLAVLALVVTGTVAFAGLDRGPSEHVSAAQVAPAAAEDLNDRNVSVASRSVERAQLVTVELDSGTKQVSTHANTISGVLAELGVVVDVATVVAPELDATVTSGMTISARTPQTEVETVTERVKFDSEELEDATLEKGKRIVETAGQDGKTTVSYVVSTIDGVEVSRTPVTTHEVAAQRTEVVRVGTLKLPDASAKVLSPSEAKTVAKSLVADRGWDASQFTCLDKLWTRESNWRVQAANPTSSAYGIPQSLPGSKMASVAGDWRTNAKTQITWGLNYISGRYGTPCGAWGASQAKGWY